jgi:hypothetical protein
MLPQLKQLLRRLCRKGNPRSPRAVSDMPRREARRALRKPPDHYHRSSTKPQGSRPSFPPLQQVRQLREVDGEPARLVQREGPGLPCNSRIGPPIERAEPLTVGVLEPRSRPGARRRATASGNGAASRRVHFTAVPSYRVRMPLYWLTYQRNARLAGVAIVPARSLMAARKRAAMDGLGIGTMFEQGHSLDPQTAARIPQDRIGRMLSRKEAAALLELIERHAGRTDRSING